MDFTHIVLPLQVDKGNGVYVLIEDKRKRYNEVENIEALCSDSEG
jgi:hypothetical protein